jgi:hypothetical protein
MTLAALALLTLAIAASSAQGTSIPVPPSYYGVNFQRMAKLGPAAQDVHLASIASLDRAAAFAKMTVNYARTNCNVGGILPHTWISPQQSNTNPEDWYGIANPSTGQPYDSARRFSYGLRLMSGQLSTPPPTRILTVC